MHGANHSSGTWQRETYKRVGRCGSYASCAASCIDTTQHHSHMTRGGHLLSGWELASSTKLLRYAVCRKGDISSLRGQHWVQKRTCDVQKGICIIKSRTSCETSANEQLFIMIAEGKPTRLCTRPGNAFTRKPTILAGGTKT